MVDFLSKLGQVAQSQPFQDALSQYAQSQALPVVDDLTWQVLAQDPQNFSRNFLAQQQVGRENSIQDRLMAQDAQRKDALRRLASGIKGTQIQGINPAAQPILDTFAEYGTMTGDVDPLLKVLQQQAQASSPDAGGATGVLVNRLMADNPNLSFADALAQVQSGFRQGVTYQGGVATPIQGIGQALGAIKGATNYGGEMGTLTAQGELKPTVEAAVKEAQDTAAANVARQLDVTKKLSQGTQISSIIDEAKTLLPLSTGSLFGAGVDVAKSAVGVSDANSKANETLKMLSGWLVSNVPRMEGPQSNFDVENYKTMAANVGDTTKPIGDRMAALNGLQLLVDKYADLNIGRGLPSNGQQVTPMQSGTLTLDQFLAE